VGFSVLDYTVLLVYLAGITAFGARFRRSQRTVRDYFLGSRRTHWLIISLSIVATETSTLTLIGVPALAYGIYARPELGGSLTYMQVVAGYVVARVVIALVLVPAYFDGDMMTAYELLRKRFGTRAKRFAASLFLVMRALAEGVRVYAASLVLAAVLAASVPGLPNLWLWAIVAVGVLTLVYTFEGGIAAVIWTDLIQLIIYVAGSMLAACELVHLVPGGWHGVLADAAAAGKLDVVSWSIDPRLPFTFWAGLVGGCFLTMASHGVDQLLVQRLLTCRNRRDAQKAIVVSGVIVFVQFLLFLSIGLMLHAYYATHPAPPMSSTDEVFPAFIVRSLPHGIAGLVIAAVFAAAMSNLSGSLNSLASSTMLDFYQPIWAPRAADADLLRLSRWLTAAWGVLLIGIAILARGWGSVFTAGLTIASIVYGPMLGAFLLGVLTTWATERAVMIGIAVSLAVMILVRLFTPLAWTWYVLAGTIVCVASARVSAVAAP
jgi:solute:Na+ symporter, SSS family